MKIVDHATAPVMQTPLFVRKEEKFLLPLSAIAPFMHALEPWATPADLDTQTRFNIIESIYFDSPDLLCFREHLQKKSPRFKMRLRRYLANGIENDNQYLLELKRKEEDLTRKSRFAIEGSDLSLLLKPHAIGSLQRLNPTLPISKLAKRLLQVQLLIRTHQLRPTLKVRYRRLAFEASGEKPVRITIDQDLSYSLIGEDTFQGMAGHQELFLVPYLQSLISNYHQRTDAVVEMKYRGELPPWVNALIEQFTLQKSSFSKYCWSLGTQSSVPKNGRACLTKSLPS